MNLNKPVLGTAGVGTAGLGVAYLISPQTFLDIYGVVLRSASESNLYRGAYGGLFLGVGLLFCFGAARPQVARSAQMALLAFMGGGAFGRLVSMVVDGQPHLLLVAVFGVELVYACAAALLLRKSSARAGATPLPAAKSR